VDFGDPVNIVPLAAGLIAGIGDLTLKFSNGFQLSGVAFGTVLVVALFHLVSRTRRNGLSDDALMLASGALPAEYESVKPRPDL
jgi:hypothetical protein